MESVSQQLTSTSLLSFPLQHIFLGKFHNLTSTILYYRILLTIINVKSINHSHFTRLVLTSDFFTIKISSALFPNCLPLLPLAEFFPPLYSFYLWSLRILLFFLLFFLSFPSLLQIFCMQLFSLFRHKERYVQYKNEFKILMLKCTLVKNTTLTLISYIITYKIMNTSSHNLT